MKKLWIIGLCVITLWGCGSQPTFETVDDVHAVPVIASARQLQMQLPEEAAQTVMESAGNSLYFCNGYTVCLQTLEAGDLDRSLRQLTGFSRDALTVLQTRKEDVRRYDTAWTSAGEGGDQTGRLTILDDGSYHYAVTIMADSEAAGDLQERWNELLSTIELVSTG